MGRFWTLLSHLQSLAGYASVVAIETPSKLDDEQWLAYWILYWSLSPSCRGGFCGASLIYEKFVRQQLRKHELMGAVRPPPNKVEEELR